MDQSITAIPGWILHIFLVLLKVKAILICIQLHCITQSLQSQL